MSQQLTLKGWEPEIRRKNTVLVPIGGLHRAVVQALQYARTLSPDVRAVYDDMETWSRLILDFLAGSAAADDPRG